MTKRRTVLITGASSGFGRLTAEKFHAEGWNVVATMRSPESETGLALMDNVVVVRLDVTEQSTIDEAVGSAVDQFGSIDVLVNNAGYGTRGYLEEASDREVYDQFNTNVFGVIRTIRAVTPLMRDAGGGRIINVSSISGLFGSYLDSLYAASKAAVQLLSESLAYELGLFNIQVKVVAPGGFGTDFLNNLKELGGHDVEALAQHHVAYVDYVERSLERQRATGGSPPDSAAVAAKIFECATSETPLHNLVGADAEALSKARATQTEAEFMSHVRSLTMPQTDALG